MDTSCKSTIPPTSFNCCPNGFLDNTSVFTLLLAGLYLISISNEANADIDDLCSKAGNL